MPEPNPFLGVHVTPGSVAWAHVLREPDGTYRVLEAAVEDAPSDPVAAVAHAAAVTGRRPFRGRGSYVALPDASGCLVGAVLEADEASLEGEDLARALHEHTPFEPGTAALRFTRRTEGGAAGFLVAAIPEAQERRFRDAARPHDDGAVGTGFAGAALARGVRDLGLAGEGDFVVEVLPRATQVYALDGVRTRRYFVPQGADDLSEAAARSLARPADQVRRAIAENRTDPALQAALGAAARPLAEDVRDVAGYHVAQRYAPKDPPPDLPAPRIVGAGPALAHDSLRAALAAQLGDRFGRIALGAASARVRWDDPDADVAALAGAVGAAIEAFEAPAARLAVVAPPREVAAPAVVRPWLRSTALVAAVGVVAALWSFRDVFAPPPAAPPRVVATAPRGPAPAAEPRDGAPPVPPLLQSTSVGPARVRIDWHSQGADAATWTLVRLAPGRDASDPSAWERVGEITADAPGSVTDMVPDRGGVYRYRLEGDAGPAEDTETRVEVPVPVGIEILAVEADGHARFRLERPWRSGPVSAEVDVAPGGSVAIALRHEAELVSIDAGARLREARVVERQDVVRRPVPSFGPDGRVVRAPDGSVPRTPRQVRLPARVLEADLEGPDGAVRTVSRKMTDG